MKVTIATDSLKGSLTSLEAGQAAAEGIRRVYEDADICIRPLADGGEGTVEALVRGMGGELKRITVTGPLGKPVVCEYGIIKESGTAVIEMAGAAGITMVDEEERNPLYTTTYGVGEVIRDAVRSGCRRFVVGIGDTGRFPLPLEAAQPMTEVSGCCRRWDTVSLIRRAGRFPMGPGGLQKSRL